MNNLQTSTIGDLAHTNDRQIKSLKIDLNVKWLKMAELLFENQKNRYFEQLGHDTFESYLAEPELSFDRRSVYRLIGIYKDFVLKHNVSQATLAEIDYTKLDMVRSSVKRLGVDNAVLLAQSLSRSDLQAELGEGIQEAEHEHTPISICSICHKHL